MSAPRDVGVYLDDILESITRIEKYTQNLTRDEFDNNIDKQDAVVHRLEIIGEATKRIPQDFRDKYPETAWQDIAKTRDKIIHHYFEVDLEIIWSIVQNDLKPLKEQVQVILKDLDGK